MPDRNHFGRVGALLFGLLLLTSCGEAHHPLALEPEESSLALSATTLVECPGSVETRTTGTLGLLGGLLSLDGHALWLPLSAVLEPTTFTLATPLSEFMELTVEAEGLLSFLFEWPVTITLDYSRCTDPGLDDAPLAVWHIDPETKELLEFMGGVDDKVARTVTFETEHLSTFSIAH